MKYPPLLCTGGYFGLQAKLCAITDYGKTDAQCYNHHPVRLFCRSS